MYGTTPELRKKYESKKSTLRLSTPTTTSLRLCTTASTKISCHLAGFRSRRDCMTRAEDVLGANNKQSTKEEFSSSSRASADRSDKYWHSWRSQYWVMLSTKCRPEVVRYRSRWRLSRLMVGILSSALRQRSSNLLAKQRNLSYGARKAKCRTAHTACSMCFNADFDMLKIWTVKSWCMKMTQNVRPAATSTKGYGSHFNAVISVGRTGVLKGDRGATNGISVMAKKATTPTRLEAPNATVTAVLSDRRRMNSPPRKRTTEICNNRGSREMIPGTCQMSRPP